MVIGLAKKNRKKGMTLIEVVVAMAIFGIVAVSFLSMFGNGYSIVFKAGHKTDANMQLQTIIDDLYKQMTITKPATTTPINTYMTGKGYNLTTTANIAVKAVGKNVNYSVDMQTIDGTAGYSVTVLVFYNNGTENIRATAFIVQGGF